MISKQHPVVQKKVEATMQNISGTMLPRTVSVISMNSTLRSCIFLWHLSDILQVMDCISVPILAEQEKLNILRKQCSDYLFVFVPL
jgi:hypothetical protein